MKALATIWTEHLKDQDKKQEFEKLIRNSGISLGRLKQILETQLGTLERVEIKSEAYDNPNWAFRQADVNGMKRSLRNVLQLLSFLDKE